ncbi:hypothetical protein A6A04_11720 [Paramagnetospirillum marisnigri]|uniref:DUF748 domain-containing protein n=1 Tax=Paramagnetospirillum marisnigri TaxID=1285242 RepID=A0A178MYC5_9PROT|nr:hypothetical protein A6A04_11720 [Paramagnetospirillum marisnigri]
MGRTLWGWQIRRRHVLAALMAAVAMVATLMVTVVPDAGLRWGLVKALRDLGMVEVGVEDADLSLFQGNVVIRRMLARPALGDVLGIKDFDLRFQWAPLLDKRVVIERLALSGVEIHVTRAADGKGFIVDGLPLALAGSAPESSNSVAWAFDVASLELTDSRLRLTDGPTTLDVAVARLVVEHLNSRRPAQAVVVALSGSLNGAEIDARGSLRPFADEPDFALDARMKGLDLAGLDSVAAKAGAAGLAGRLSLVASLKGAMAAGGLRIGGDGRVELEQFTLAAPVKAGAGSLALDVRRGVWDGETLSLAGEVSASALAIRHDQAQGKLAGLKLEVDKADWRGGRLGLSARLEAQGLAGSNGSDSGSAASLVVDAPELSWDGKLDWRGAARLAGAKVLAAGLDVTPDAAAWTGRLELAPGAGEPSGRAEGRLELGPLAFKGFDFAYAHRHLNLDGQVDFGAKGKLPLAGRLKLKGEGISLKEPAKGMDWLAMDKVDLADLAISRDGAVAAERLITSGMAAVRREGKGRGKGDHSWRLEARALRLDHPSLAADGGLAVSDIRLDGMTARIARAADGNWVGLPSGGGGDGGAAKSASESRMPALSLGRLQVGGGSRVLFRDNSLGEGVRLDVNGLDVTLSDLDSAKPDRDSPFVIKAEVGGASVGLTGVVHPFADVPGGRLDGTIKALELPPLSPYLAEGLGVHLRTGQFSGSFSGGARGGKLDGKLEVDLANLAIAPPDPNAPMVRKLDMPLETVLNLLRDSEGRIRLSLPVRGDLANPDLDVSDAVSQAVAGAMKATVLTTLKLAFPLAALIELAMDANDGPALSLSPLDFAPGTSVLNDDHRRRLEDVAHLLRERPGLTITLCGKADGADWPALVARRRAEDRPLLTRLERLVGIERKEAEAGTPDHDSLINLANSRVTLAKQFLVDGAGVEAGRVFACRAEIEADGGKGPRVDLLL